MLFFENTKNKPLTVHVVTLAPVIKFVLRITLLRALIAFRFSHEDIASSRIGITAYFFL